MSTADNDPSMDDILASIRKIISDDDARAQSGEQRASDHPGRMTLPTGGDVRPSSSSPAADDVLLLTDLIEEGQPVPSAPPPPPPRNDPAPIQSPSTPPDWSHPPMPQPTSDVPQGQASPMSALVESEAAGATMSALQRLNQAMQDSAPPVVASDPGPSLGGGSSKTIEDMVGEMLRPMLKEWLDKNLPSLVEGIVEREISRLTRR